MNVIEEIRMSRKSMLTEEQKSRILAIMKKELKSNYSAIVYGAPHFGKWEFRDDCITRCEAPYSFHPAIEEWLTSLGFRCSRYHNAGGIEQGLMVRI